MKTYYHRLLISFVFIIFLAGCNNMASAKPAAESATNDFHEKYNLRNFKSIFDESHDDFKKATNLEGFEVFMEAVHSKLGIILSSENQTWNVRSFNLSTSVVLSKNSTFEKGQGIETFTYRVEDGKALLVGYNISSRDLIVN